MRDLWEQHRGKWIGAAAGLFFGIIYLFAGFWDMLIVLLLVGIGFWFGKKSDERESALQAIWEWLRRLNDRWRMFR
ncbi:DUF2273 domain-containing protein [Marinicrinis lubricantis]|uniref:DUF2273 domain-containing protein n=1 Tax=Marinicrinis lubricantis TaxID=2086470 RepID=A0ABW1IRL1_9BACL